MTTYDLTGTNYDAIDSGEIFGTHHRLHARFRVAKATNPNSIHWLYYVPPTSRTRKTFGGPIVPGPDVFAVAQATVIAAVPLASRDADWPLIELELDDHVIVDGAEFVLTCRNPFSGAEFVPVAAEVVQ